MDDKKRAAGPSHGSPASVGEPTRSYSVKAYLLLAILTLYVDAVVFGSFDLYADANEELTLAIMLSLAFTQVSLFSVAATAPRNRFRVWAALMVPISSGAFGAALGWALDDGDDFPYMVVLACIFLAAGVAVIVVLGPLRFWQAMRRSQRTDRTDWQIRYSSSTCCDAGRCDHGRRNTVWTRFTR